MAGGNGTTMKVSAALRKAGLPVLRWSGTVGSLSRHGISVGNNGPSRTHVDMHFGDFEENPRAERREREAADEIEAVLLARGFAYTRHTIPTRSGTAYSFTVYRTHQDPLYKAHLAVKTVPQPEERPETPADPEQAAIDACSLQVAKLTQTTWAVRHGGQRMAYSIVRSGKGARARNAVQARGSRPIDKGLRSLAEALTAVQADIDTQEV